MSLTPVPPRKPAYRGIVARVVVLPVMLIGCAVSSAWSVRLACADYWFRRQTVPGTEKALTFTPGQAEYYARLAFLEPGQNKTAAMEALQRAVALNPSDAPSWIELGLRYEAAGSPPLAEKCLLRAAVEDRQYFPRWTLANYYCRANEVDRFWFWAKQAAGMVHDDPAPLFRLCGRVAEDGALIDRLNISRGDLRAAYLEYLLHQGRLDLIGPASRHLLHATGHSDVPLLLRTCDRLLESKNVVSALEIWNGLAERHRIPFGRLQVATGEVLTNGDFRSSPVSQGFDWRLPPTNGVGASADESGGLRLSFSGSQSEDCEPLVQFVPVQENTDYELKSEYRTEGIAAVSGLDWRITDQNAGRTLADAHALSGESGRIAFATPAGCHIARVALAYRRVPGTTRIEGSIILRRVELKPAR
jgi:tetratricopeptide (TPR) repeat protein